MSFIHLHCHSHYSFLDGAMSPADLAKTAKAHGMEAIALTDSSNMCGLVEFAQTCKDEGIRPIFGADLWTIPADWKPGEDEDAKRTPAPGYLLTFLVENEAGYRNLCQIISIAHRHRNFVPRIRLDQLKEHTEGLIVLCGPQHGISAMLPAQDQVTELQILKTIYGPNLFLELVDWGDTDGSPNERIRALSEENSIQTLVTNNARYVDQKGTVLLNLMHGIALGHTLARPGDAKPHTTDQATLKTSEEMLELFPADQDAVLRSVQISDRCRYTLELGTPFLPNSQPPEELTTLKARWEWLLEWFPPPKSFGDHHPPPTSDPPEGWDLVDQYFAWYARIGLEKRLDLEPSNLTFDTRKAYEDRLEMELGVIQDMKFCAYHLIVGEFINWAKDNGISVGPGRGSAAGSVATWAMRITDINPLQFGLMFERYLNPKRVSMPDIDVDFEQERREEVIDHVREKYGAAQVGQILTIGTMKAKAALKDCARACGIHFNDANEWSKEIEEGPKVKLSEALKGKKLQALMRGKPSFRHVARLALAMEKRPRQTGIHAAGVIITSKPIAQFAPMHFEPTKDGAGKTMTGVEMNAAEKLGLVKFDFLGLKTLDIIERTRDSVAARTGTRPEIFDPLFDDPAVFKLLGEGDSLGLFQVESHGMQDLLRRMQPDTMEDIVAIQALYRPGPLGSGMVDQYVEVKHGRAEVQYPHPLLEEVLKPTNGVIVYQEQVMKAAQVLAGYDLGGADLLRRAMGKKKQKEMDAQRALFIEGCGNNNIASEDAERIFNLIDHFAGYGFNKSHSASYGVICYLTCKLKAHHRADLMAAAMSFEYGDRDKLVAYVNDCLRAGIPVLRPDIHKSQIHFSVEAHPQAEGGLAIRYGLQAIKSLGDSAIQNLLTSREEKPFISLQDLRDRSKGNKTTTEALITSGALDDLGIPRFELWWEVNRPKVKPLKTRAGQQQISLFSGKTVAEEETERQAEVEAEARPRTWSYTERLDREYASLGSWLSGHPLDRFSDVERRVRTASVLELKNYKKGKPITIIGVITKIHRIETRHGDKMGYFTVADRIGLAEVVLRPPQWRRYSKMISRGECVSVRGKLDRDGDQGKLVVEHVDTLKGMRTNMATTLKLDMPLDLSDEKLNQIRALLHRFIIGQKRKGCRLRIIIRNSDKDYEAELMLDGDPVIEAHPDLFDEMELLTGRPDSLHLP